MAAEASFVLFIVLVVVAILGALRYQDRIRRVVAGQFATRVRARRDNQAGTERGGAEDEPEGLTSEQRSKAELARLQQLIDGRKQVARETDISYHLWGLYRTHFRDPGQEISPRLPLEGEWYDVRILKAASENGLHVFDFELQGARYRFVDDEDKQGWNDNAKYFGLFLHDEAGRCLIEVPMKVNVDRSGRRYSIASDGPRAFLPGNWVSDFINVNLKHQSLRNEEIRAQKHQERLWEIEDLKNRFGIRD